MRMPRTSRLGLFLALFLLLQPAHDPARAFDRANAPRLHRGGAVSRPGDAAVLPASAYPDATPRFHNGETLQCSDCHVMHASQTHAYDTPGLGALQAVPFTGAPSAMLLRAADPLDLCLSCHDGQNFAPDVLGSDVNGLEQRSAGWFASPEVPNPNGHDLARGLPGAGRSDYCDRCHFGQGARQQVTCIDCHDPHGNGRARNLRWASWPEGTPDLGLFVNPASTGMRKYERENVAFGTLDSDALREVSSICIDCHHVFSGDHYVDPDGDGIHGLHPTYESERGSTNRIAQGAARGSTAPAHWLGGVGSGFGVTPRVRPMTANATDYASARVVNPATNGVFCLSCHSAHGSDQAFGLVFPATFGAAASGCDQCHLVADAPGATQEPSFAR